MANIGDWLGILSEIGLGTTSRATVLLAGTLALAWLMRDGPAISRHALWTVTGVALLALPGLPLVLPEVGIPVPVMATDSGGDEEDGGAIVSGAVEGRAVDSGGDGGAVDRGAVAEGEPRWIGVGADRPGVGAASSDDWDPEGVESDRVGGDPDRRRMTAVVGTGPAWRAILIVGWLVGFGFVMASLGAGLWRVQRIVREADPAGDDEAWNTALAMASRRYTVPRRTRLAFTAAFSTPVATGFLRPVILFPESAREWSVERRELVLLHELVHVARRDALRQIAGRLARALYWYHPLVWMAARAAVLAREQACDEAVVALGNRPSTYARHLMELSEPAPAPTVTLSLVERSQLEKRLMAILAPPRPLRPWMPLAAAVGACSWTVMVAVATPAPVAVMPGWGATEASPPLEADDRAAGTAYVSERVDSSEASLSPSVAVGRTPIANEPSTERVDRSGASLPRIVTAGLASTADEPFSERVRAMPPQQTGCAVDRLRGDFSGFFSTIPDAPGAATDAFGWTAGDRVIQHRLDGVTICMRAHGDVAFDASGSQIESMANGSWVVLATRSDERTLRLEVRPGAAGLENSWFVDELERPFDPAAAAWRDALLPVLAGYWEISRLRGQVSSLRGAISSVRGQRSSLLGQISSNRGQVSSMRGQISSIRGQESSLRGRISSLRGNTSSLRSAQRATGDPVTRERLNQEIAGVEARIREVEQEIGDYDAAARVAEVERRIEEFDVDSRVRQVEVRLEDLDVEGRARALESEIESIDADRRVEEIEARLGPQVQQLRDAITRID